MAEGKGEEQPRQGKELVWQSLRVCVPSKRGRARRALDDVSGRAVPGRVAAIMGPSGGGKSTLLNAITNRTPATAGVSIEGGRLLLDGVPANRAPLKLAYVTQNNLAYAQLTVRETLSLAAQLRSTNPERVDRVIRLMGLSACADTPVGDDSTPGISGGERKRLALACDALGDPAIFCADEPTTGLDTFAAFQVMENLRSLAHEYGKTVIVSLHQPRGAIWNKVDDLYLLSEGQLVYGGAREDAAGFFKGLGLNPDVGTSEAEFVVDAVSVDYSNQQRHDDSLRAIANYARACKEKQSREKQAVPHARVNGAANGTDGDGKNLRSEQRPLVNAPTQFRLLLSRSWKQVLRDKKARSSRIASTVSSATTFAILFWRLSRDSASIKSRIGLMQVSAVSTAMTSLVKTIGVFSKEKQIVNQERARGLYNPGPLATAKVIAETPLASIYPLLFGAIVYPSTRLRPSFDAACRFAGIVTLESFSASGIGLAVSAATPSYEAASATGPSIMTMFIVFSSFAPKTPWVLSWIPKISVIGRAVEALMLNEVCYSQLDIPFFHNS
jgi:ABC-type multidrug transport system ATPase subunit